MFYPSHINRHSARAKRPPALARAALLALATVALAACGGGGDGDDPPNLPPGTGPGGNLPAPSINALAGEWVQKGCVRAGGESFKKTLRANVTSTTTLDYFEGVLSFRGNDCTGAFQQVGPSKLGTVTFVRSEASQTLAAHWGTLLTVTNTRFGTIWALRPGNTLCLLGDGIPTIQPTLASVASSLATVPVDNCFVR